MTDSWTTRTLDEVCEFRNGLWKGEEPPFVRVGVIRNTNFTKDGTLDDSDIASLDVEEKKFAKRRLQLGDIILEKSGGGPKQPVGRVALFDKESGAFSFSNFTAALRVKHPAELDFRFLHKFLLWTYLSGITEGMQSHSTGIRNLDGNAYKAIQISYPRLAEQQRIVAFLDNALDGVSSAKAHAERNLLSSRDLFESQLQAIFTRLDSAVPSHLPLEELTEPESPITYGVVKPGAEGDVAFVRGGDLSRGRLLTHQLRTITREVSLQYKRTLLRGGELLISLVGQPGQVAVVPRELAGANIARQVGLIRLQSRMNAAFVRLFLQSSVGREALGARQSGSVQQVINLGELRQVRIPVPSRDIQDHAVEALEALSEDTLRLESLYGRKSDELEVLKTALLRHAFTAQLSTPI